MDKTKTVYGYDPISFEFTGAQYAHLCPVTKNMYLIPANTVDFAPVDFEDGFAFVLENNEWVKIADERGREIYSCETGEIVGHVNNLIGDVKENQTTLKPEVGQTWDGEKWITPVVVEKVLTYKEKRQAEYGTTAEQIEFITEFGLDAWQAKVATIKATYPKGE